mmetsp:Transcript_15862/g.23212  ORF Transcript_15862/g.23212 Transcript_15862/m.23212 type:complete len:88 (-) Transcript_15862:312-575(-)
MENIFKIRVPSTRLQKSWLVTPSGINSPRAGTTAKCRDKMKVPARCIYKVTATKHVALPTVPLPIAKTISKRESIRDYLFLCPSHKI